MKRCPCRTSHSHNYSLHKVHCFKWIIRALFIRIAKWRLNAGMGQGQEWSPFWTRTPLSFLISNFSRFCVCRIDRLSLAPFVADWLYAMYMMNTKINSWSSIRRYGDPDVMLRQTEHDRRVTVAISIRVAGGRGSKFISEMPNFDPGRQRY